MNTLRGTAIRSLTALALLAAVTGSGRAADEDAALRKKALALNDVTGDASANAAFKELLKDAAAARKLLAVAVKMSKEKPQPFNVNAAYILARVGQSLKDFEPALTFYRLYTDQAVKLQSGKKLVQAYGGLIQLLYDNEQYAECVKACREFLDLDAGDLVDDLKEVVQRRRIMAMVKLGEVDKANKILDKLIDDNPKNWLNRELRARILRDQNKNEEAVKIYLDLIDQIQKDDRLEKEDRQLYVTDIRYTLSGVYIDLKQVDKSAEQLKLLLEKDPNNPTYNNDLGYIWADHDMNLTEAEKLIRKALEEDKKKRKKENPDLKPDEDKDHPAYLDSLGWVLYKQKKYKEAKPPLEEAVKDADGQDPVVYDHLGDVQWALGEKKEALATWKKALEIAGKSKRDKETKAAIEKKIKDRQ
jgi:tetratricopeptide (TPR) repeat protein